MDNKPRNLNEYYDWSNDYIAKFNIAYDKQFPVYNGVHYAKLWKEFKIKWLANNLKDAKKHYYKGNPWCEDEVYDHMEDHLRKLDPNHEMLQVVGSRDE